MRGDAAFHSRHCRDFLPVAMRSHTGRAIDFLLEHQYVASGTVAAKDGQAKTDRGDLIHMVTEGTGMGLIQSSAIASSSFAKSNEQGGLGIAMAYFRRVLWVITFLRYADNLFWLL